MLYRPHHAMKRFGLDEIGQQRSDYAAHKPLEFILDLLTFFASCAFSLAWGRKKRPMRFSNRGGARLMPRVLAAPVRAMSSYADKPIVRGTRFDASVASASQFL